MMYERELSDEEVLQNRIADMKIEEQEEEYNKTITMLICLVCTFMEI